MTGQAICERCNGFGCQRRDGWRAVPYPCPVDSAVIPAKESSTWRSEMKARREAQRPVAEASLAEEQALRLRMSALLDAREQVALEIEETKHKIWLAHKRHIAALCGELTE
jgi:hypothetical protein